MLTHRMLAKRGESVNSRIAQTQSLGPASGRFIDFEETATAFTDKIASAAFIPFANLTYVDATGGDGRPYCLAWSKVATSSAWGDMGSNDWMVFFVSEAVVNRTISTYTPNGTDPYYGGVMSLYVGNNAVTVTLQPYYAIFRYNVATAIDSFFTPWNDKYNLKDDGSVYAFAAVKRGNYLLHFGYKYGDSNGELLGQSIDGSTVDGLRGDSDFSTAWNACNFAAEVGLAHGAYGCTANRCRVIETDSSGNEYREDDKNGNFCGNPAYPAWPSLAGAIDRPFMEAWAKDSDGTYQIPSSPNPISGQCSEAGAIEHPQKYLSTGLFKLSSGAPKNDVICAALKWMCDRAVDDGVKAACPTLFYGDI